ncbi:MAG TPA: hypothetical protein VK280_05035 [Streptosporangiaceae bacterium]|nr:hypothetical protein [Streptosporangiaceae bacterium]
MRMARYARRGAVALAICGLAVLVAGCAAWKAESGPAVPTASAGPLAGLTASEILTRAVADLDAASSVHITGSTKLPGQNTAVDLTVGAHGCTGTIEIAGQGSVLLLGTGDTVWMKPDEQFYRATGVSAAEMSQLAGKYLRISASKSGIGALCYLGQLATQISGGAGHVVLGRTMTVLGQPALQLNDVKQPGDAYVTAAARPEFLRVGSGGGGYMDFTDYNAPFTVTPPPAAQTVDGASYNF